MFSLFRRRKTGKHAANRADGVSVNALIHKEEMSDESSDQGFNGPYDDQNWVEDALPRADFGSLRIPHIAGTQFRVEGGEDGTPNTQLSGVMVTDEQSGLHLSVCAAPRTEALWPEICAETYKQFANNGTIISQVESEFGSELQAVLDTPDGEQRVRFIGIDGPRWLLRGVFSGMAGQDPAASDVLKHVLRGTIVIRGNEPKPVREPLPLHLPQGTQPME